MRIFQNTVIVLVATMLTAGAVYAGVSAVGTPSVAISASSDGGAGELVCPATGCSAVSCHAAGGAAAATAEDGTSDLQACPRTGCTSQGCHATEGSSPGGSGHGHGGYGVPGTSGDGTREWPTT